MTATAHALIATLIAAKIHNPALALPLSFASHFVCDFIPHWDEGTHWREKTPNQFLYETVFDTAVSVVASTLLYILISPHDDFLLLYSCVFLSQLPDYLMTPYLIFNRQEWWTCWSKWAYRLQHKINQKLDKPWGIVTTVATIVGAYILLFKVF